MPAASSLTHITFILHGRASYPGGPDQVLVGWRVAEFPRVGFFPVRGFPVIGAGRRHIPYFRGLTQAQRVRASELLTHLTRWGLIARLRPCQVQTRALEVPRFQTNNLLGGILPPTVICAVEATTITPDITRPASPVVHSPPKSMAKETLRRRRRFYHAYAQQNVKQRAETARWGCGKHGAGLRNGHLSGALRRHSGLAHANSARAASLRPPNPL